MQAQQCRSTTALLLQTPQSCFGHGAKGVRRVLKGLSPSPINVKGMQQSCVGEGSPYETVTSPRAPPHLLSSQFSCAVVILVCFSFGLFFWPPPILVWSFGYFKFFLVLPGLHLPTPEWELFLLPVTPRHSRTSSRVSYSRRISQRGAEPRGWAPNCFVVPLWSQPGVQRGQQLQWHSHSFHRAPSQDRLLISQELLSCCQRLTNGGQHWTDLPLSSWSQGKELHLSRAH